MKRTRTNECVSEYACYLTLAVSNASLDKCRVLSVSSDLIERRGEETETRERGRESEEGGRESRGANKQTERRYKDTDIRSLQESKRYNDRNMKEHSNTVRCEACIVLKVVQR
jgi:hypothetical protein